MASVQNRDIIAIGGSDGCGAVLRTLIADLPADLPASVFVSTHIPTHSPGFLPELLSSRAAIPVSQAIDGQPIERGHVYVAAPDRPDRLAQAGSETVVALAQGAPRRSSGGQRAVRAPSSADQPPPIDWYKAT